MKDKLTILFAMLATAAALFYEMIRFTSNVTKDGIKLKILKNSEEPIFDSIRDDLNPIYVFDVENSQFDLDELESWDDVLQQWNKASGSSGGKLVFLEMSNVSISMCKIQASNVSFYIQPGERTVFVTRANGTSSLKYTIFTKGFIKTKLYF